MNPADADLVAQLRGGDPAALAKVYDRYAELLLALAYRILGDRSEAEDVLLETLERAWRTVDHFDPDRGSLRVWLTVMVRSRSLDLIRARQRRERAVADAGRSGLDGLGPLGEVVPDAADSAERDELRHHVIEALRELPSAQRQALELAYYGGLSQSEIATSLNVPLGTVKTRMRDGLQRLRKVLQPIHAEHGT